MNRADPTTAQVWTIRRMVNWMTEDFTKRGLSSPRLDAELLVAHVLDVPRVRLYMDLDRPLQANELSTIRQLVGRRREHEPVAHILGRREFYGRSFQVTPDVLIPRPDTETLVERALAVIDEGDVTEVWDLCTGSGAIGLSLLAARKKIRCVLSDISEAALAVARSNAQALEVSARARFVRGDAFSCFDAHERASLICINPPYVTSAELRELEREVRDYEPHLALDAGQDGLSFYRRLLPELHRRITAGGVGLLECGRGQGQEIAHLAREQGFLVPKIHNDLSGTGRVVELRVDERRLM